MITLEGLIKFIAELVSRKTFYGEVVIKIGGGYIAIVERKETIKELQ